LETISILELDGTSILKVFYCGRYRKWNLPNTLLIIVDKNKIIDNRFYQDITVGGSNGGAYLKKDIAGNPWDGNNKKYCFHYCVITDDVSLDNCIIDDNFEYKTYEEMTEISTLMLKINNLRAFL